MNFRLQLHDQPRRGRSGEEDDALTAVVVALVIFVSRCPAAPIRLCEFRVTNPSVGLRLDERLVI